MDGARNLRLQGAGLLLQHFHRGAVDFVGEVELAPRRLSGRNQEQDRRNQKIDAAENGGGKNRAPDLHQREIGR